MRIRQKEYCPGNLSTSSRRSFIKSGMIATSGLVASMPTFKSPDKIKLGIVGVGWWGIDFLIKYALETDRFDIIGLCDVSSKALTDAKAVISEGSESDPRAFKHYQDLYELKDLEAVIIASPPHWHALQFIEACRKGLDIWLEKPISYDIREGQAMMAAYQAAGNIVNVDFPRLYNTVNGEVKDFIQSGKAGDILQVDFNVHNHTGYPDVQPIPNYLDYEAFCGPAPLVPYRSSPDRGKPSWRAQKDFDRGVLADRGIHHLQNIRTVMNLDLPDQISAVGGIGQRDGREHPDHLHVLFQFGDLPVKWNQKSWGYTSPLPHTNIGVYYLGSKATIFANDTGWEIYPADGSLKKTYGDLKLTYGQEKFMQMVQRVFLAQFNTFADAIMVKSDRSIRGTFREGYISTACVNYADLAYQTKRMVKINKTTMEIEGNDAANGMLKRPYRKGYLHPYSLRTNVAK